MAWWRSAARRVSRHWPGHGYVLEHGPETWLVLASRGRCRSCRAGRGLSTVRDALSSLAKTFTCRDWTIHAAVFVRVFGTAERASQHSPSQG
jgi:hypothetical protein